ncbi:uncharacterized protein LOC119732802 [Patiria miniata]|uniref:Death domain-containing protein n=1 Tax=Patiria miniata TaxID=46514 RepID=A0A914AG35_PATMI|nr:uncharacterized protein LOC119732802 [Patiria miniata]
MVEFGSIIMTTNTPSATGSGGHDLDVTYKIAGKVGGIVGGIGGFLVALLALCFAIYQYIGKRRSQCEETNLDDDHPQVPDISEPVLRKISERLGSEWQKLATHLGLSAAEIERMVMDDPGQTENQIFNMLVKWRRKQREVLCTALMEMGKMDIAEDMIDFSDPVLRKISERLGSEWQKLATHLGLSAAEIDNIMMDDPGQTENQILNMLVEWRRKKRKVLCTALVKIGRTNIAEDFIGISDLDLRMISNKLGSEWRKLATHLGLRAATIDRIVMDDPGQTEYQIFIMLVKWWRQQSTSTDQRDELCTALMKICRMDIAEDLIGRKLDDEPPRVLEETPPPAVEDIPVNHPESNKQQKKQKGTTSSAGQMLSQEDVGHRDKSQPDAQDGGAKEQSKSEGTKSSERQEQEDVGHRDIPHPEDQEGWAKEQKKPKRTTSSEGQRPGQEEVGHQDKPQLEVQEERAKEASMHKGTTSSEGQRQNQQEACGTYPNVQKETMQSSEEYGLKGSTYKKSGHGQVGVTPSNQSEIQETVVREMTSQDQQLMQGPKSVQDIVPVGQTSSRSPAVLGHGPGQLVSVDSMSVSGKNCPVFLGAVNQPTFTLNVQSLKVTGKSSGFPKMSIETGVTRQGGEDRRLTDALGIARTALHEISAILNSCDGELEKVISGSVTFVVRFKSREGLNKLWSMYTTGELAKKLTEILISDELTTEDKSDLAIQATIPESDYDRACKFFDELEKDQQKDEEDSSSMEEVQHTQLGESSTATTAYSSDPTEYAEDRCEEKVKTSFMTTGISDPDLYKISVMFGSEWQKLATHLGLSAAEIDRIVEDDPGQTENQIFNMLVKWKRKQGEVLYKVLMKMGRTDIVEELIGFSDLILHKISGMLGSEWRKLATHLGFSTAEINRIVEDDPGQTQNQIFNMLVKWRRQQSTSTDQRDVFFTALMQIKRTNTVENLIELIQDLTLQPDDIMVSFDVVSFFISIPTSDACTIAKDRLQADTTLQDRTDLTPDQLQDLLITCVNSSSFRWRDKFFEQSAVTSMGSPISPVLADLIMEEFEQTAIATADHQPKVWLRYVDDTFVIWQHGQGNLQLFLEHFKKLHSSIQFTMEQERDESQTEVLLAVSTASPPTRTDTCTATLSTTQESSPPSTEPSSAERTTSATMNTYLKNFITALQCNGYQPSQVKTQDPRTIPGHLGCTGFHIKDHPITWNQAELLTSIDRRYPRRIREAIKIIKHNTVPQDIGFHISNIWRPILKSKSDGSPIP